MNSNKSIFSIYNFDFLFAYINGHINCISYVNTNFFLINYYLNKNGIKKEWKTIKKIIYSFYILCMRNVFVAIMNNKKEKLLLCLSRFAYLFANLLN